VELFQLPAIAVELTIMHCKCVGGRLQVRGYEVMAAIGLFAVGTLGMLKLLLYQNI
jgi:hypothetical protein